MTTGPALHRAVSFEGFYFDRTDALILASSRIGGICTGVLIALVLTCTVFPVSGTGEVRWATRTALLSLRRTSWL